LRLRRYAARDLLSRLNLQKKSACAARLLRQAILFRAIAVMAAAVAGCAAGASPRR
jgi:hypothetical protein